MKISHFSVHSWIQIKEDNIQNIHTVKAVTDNYDPWYNNSCFWYTIREKSFTEFLHYA